jgi:hypothetical protein
MPEHPNHRAFNEQIIQSTRQWLEDGDFRHRHKRRQQDFTRRSPLDFVNTAVLLLQKTVRSAHRHLSEFFDRLGPSAASVTASAWCQGRLRLRHTAFIELNQRTILEPVYQVGSAFEVRRWRGHRLLSIDSSLLHLPPTEEVGREFGWVQCQNQKGHCGRYAQGRLSVLTDVLNRLAVQTLLVGWQTGERALAARHLEATGSEDLVLMDRGFAGYELFARFVVAGRHFVCRCPRYSFGAVNRLFKEDREGRSVVATLTPANGTVGDIRAAELPEELQIRLVTVRLSTGELEVLATNLLDEQVYETSAFAELYHQRWGIETFYGLLKGRLDLENFSGRSVEAVRQDLYATIFLSNLESVLSRPVQDRLARDSAPLRQAQQVNRAVSFHALKCNLIALLLSRDPPSLVLEKLDRLFAGNPVSVRPQRKVPRTKISAWRSYWFHRHVRKSVF